MPRKKRRNVDYPRVLPSVDPDVAHILVGRRVVSVPLPARKARGLPANLERVFILNAELRRLAARGRVIAAPAADERGATDGRA